MAKEQNDYRAVVDIGSNGIRFSITDLDESTARVLPTVYTDRCKVSLYDVQYDAAGKKIPIPDKVFAEVSAAMVRFKRTCEDFTVPRGNVQVVATEATRQALNSGQFRQMIASETGWNVRLLSKEEEGRFGAEGICSSFSNLDSALVFDLGGGSMQLTVISPSEGGPQSRLGELISLPFGAAALTRSFGTESSDKTESGEFEHAIRSRLQQALTDLGTAKHIDKVSTLLLSGGGFRGWGYTLMGTHAIQPYPISIINGFHVHGFSAEPVETELSSTFRVSNRRATQLPAISILVSILKDLLPSITSIYFAQGALREGLLFSSLPAAITSQHPLIASTRPYAPRSASDLLKTLKSGIPKDLPPNEPHFRCLSDFTLLTATINLLIAQPDFPKDTAAAIALRSTTSGILASTHGLSHADRALLALVLCERYGGKLNTEDSIFQQKLQELVGNHLSWTATYIGRVAVTIAAIYPSGVVKEERMKLVTAFKPEEGNEGVIKVKISVGETDEGLARELAEVLEKMGKKKMRQRFKGAGIKVRASVEI